jgi:hypothetical protein
MLPTVVVKIFLDYVDDREAIILCDVFGYNSELYQIKNTVDLTKWTKTDGVPKKVYWSEDIKVYPENAVVITKLEDLYRNPEIYEVELDKRASIGIYIICYYENVRPHRDDGPAIIYSCGTKDYYRNGFLHRDDGPARIYADGTKEYWQNGHKN